MYTTHMYCDISFSEITTRHIAARLFVFMSIYLRQQARFYHMHTRKIFLWFSFYIDVGGECVAFWQRIRLIDLCTPIPRVGFGSHWSVTLTRNLSVLVMKALCCDQRIKPACNRHVNLRLLVLLSHVHFESA